MQGGKVALGTGKTNGVVKLLSFLRQQTGTGLCDKGFEILGNQDFAVTARNLVPGEVVPADRFQKGNESTLVFRLTVATIIVFQLCHAPTPPFSPVLLR